MQPPHLGTNGLRYNLIATFYYLSASLRPVSLSYKIHPDAYSGCLPRPAVHLSAVFLPLWLSTTARQASKAPPTALPVSTVCWLGCQPGSVAPARPQDPVCSWRAQPLSGPFAIPLGSLSRSCQQLLEPPATLHLPSTSAAHSAAWCLATPKNFE